MKRITNETFIGGDVQVDSKHFVGCTFSNCSIVWNGQSVKFDQCHFNNIKIMTNNDTIRRAWQFMQSFQNIMNSAKVH